MVMMNRTQPPTQERAGYRIRGKLNRTKLPNENDSAVINGRPLPPPARRPEFGVTPLPAAQPHPKSASRLLPAPEARPKTAVRPLPAVRITSRSPRQTSAARFCTSRSLRQTSAAQFCTSRNLRQTSAVRFCTSRSLRQTSARTCWASKMSSDRNGSAKGAQCYSPGSASLRAQPWVRCHRENLALQGRH